MPAKRKTPIAAALLGATLALGSVGICGACIVGILWYAVGEADEYLSYYKTADWVSRRSTLAKLEFAGQAKFVAFSPDSEQILAGIDSYSKWEAKEWHGEVRVWSVETKKEIHLERFELFIRSMRMHPDGKRLLVATSNEVTGRPRVPKKAQISIYEYPTFRLLHQVDVGKTIAQGGAKFSPDGKRIAVQKKDSFEHWDPWEIVTYDTDGLKLVATIGELNHMALFEFTPDSKYVIGGYYSRIKPHNPNESKGYFDPVTDAFDVETGKRQRRFPGLVQPGFAHFGKRLMIFSGTDNTYELESLEKYHPVEVPDYLRGVHPRTESPDGRWRILKKAQWNRKRPNTTEVGLADTKKEQLIKIYRDNSYREVHPTCEAFAPNSKHFAVGRSAYREVKAEEAPGDAMGDVLLFTVPE